MKKTLLLLFCLGFPMAGFAQHVDVTSLISHLHNYVKHDIGIGEFREIHPNLRVLDISVNARADVQYYDAGSPSVRIYLQFYFEDFSYTDNYGRLINAEISEIADPSRFSASFKAYYYLNTKFGKTPTSYVFQRVIHGKEDDGLITSLGDVWYASKEELIKGGNNNPSNVEIFRNLQASVQVAKFSEGSVNPRSEIRKFIEGKLQEQEEIEKQKEQESLKNDLLSKANRAGTTEEKINYLEEAEKYANSQDEKKTINQRIQDLRNEVNQEGQAQEVANTDDDEKSQTNNTTSNQQQREETKRLERIRQEQEEREREEGARMMAEGVVGLAKGVEEGILTGIILTYNMRADESEWEIGDALTTAINTDTYELGIQMGKNANSGFSFGYGAGNAYIDNDSYSSYIYTAGIDIGILNLLEFDQVYAFQISIGGEFGGGGAEYTDSNYSGSETWEIYEDVTFYGGHLNAKLMKYFVVAYGYGLSTGSVKKDGESKDFDEEYSKLTLGLRIPF